MLLYHFRYIIHLTLNRENMQVNDTYVHDGHGDDGHVNENESVSGHALLPQRERENSPYSDLGFHANCGDADVDWWAVSGDDHWSRNHLIVVPLPAPVALAVRSNRHHLNYYYCFHYYYY